MLNNVVLVGRLTKDPSLSEGENETKRLNITIAIPRDYKIKMVHMILILLVVFFGII